MNIPADFVKESDRQRLHHLELTKKDLEWSLQRTAHDFGVTFNDDDRALFEHALRAANTLTGRTDLTPGKVMSVAFDPWAIPGSGKWCVCVSFWTSLNWAPAYADVSPEQLWTAWDTSREI